MNAIVAIGICVMMAHAVNKNTYTDVLEKMPKIVSSDSIDIPVVFTYMLMLLFKAGNSSIIDHVFLSASYVTGLRLLMNIVTPNTLKHEYSLPFVIACTLAIINYSFVNRKYTYVVYSIAFIYTLILISSDKTDSANSIYDWVLTHLSFIFSRFYLKI